MIDLTSDVSGFFRDRLGEALSRRGVELSDFALVYLVNLLSEYASASPDEAMSRPLVERMAEALEATGTVEQLRKYRELGDEALYILGFFSDNLERRGIARSYVASMGGRAYDAAGRLARRREGAFSIVYPELAEKFDVVASAFDDVRETTDLRTPQDIVRLYERWKRTGSQVLAERLQQEGVYPQQAGRKLVH
ncbi:MAG: hypothetical protein KC416_06585 [Myxococcales bacterium]|nr:hypothetical protein [Myxococcales bacterium]